MAADGTLLTMTTPLGDGVLQPIALEAEEAISAPFRFHVEMVSETASISADDMLYHPACVTVDRAKTAPRHFHGIVRAFWSNGMRDGMYVYEAELVPQWWFANQTADCRIFHNMSVVDILTQLFNENGIAAFGVHISGEQTPLPFVVQYNETDFQFAARLMEAAGYYYFHVHGRDGHSLELADNNSAFTSIPDPKVELLSKGGALNGISSWRRLVATAVGKVMLQDYDPLAPATPVEGEQTTVLKTSGHARRDVFEWSALTTKASEATARARIREEAAEAFATLFEGTGEDQEFYPGGKFSLQQGPLVTDDAGEYVLRSVTHHASEAEHGGGGAASYSNSFTAFPAATTWRQPIVVPRPVMSGIYTAVVLGPEGEEIYTDPDGHGMIKVRFHWDHLACATADNTIWIRVMQPWSGAGWGVQHIPRVGTEVAVAFIDGDPDCPIVVGSSYNATHKHPLTLPDDKTKSGIRSRSSLKGGTSNFSEFWIDDKKGSELVFLHAEKDHTEEVEHDQSITVDHDRTVLVKHDEKITIDHDQKILVKNDQTMTVTQNRTTEISQGNDKLTVKTGNLTTEVSMGNMSDTVKMGDLSTEVNMGNITVKAGLGKIEQQAMQSIELKVGASSVKIDQMGVTIKGMMIKIEGTVMTDVKGVMTTVTGSAMTQVKGGLVMIGP